MSEPVKTLVLEIQETPKHALLRSYPPIQHLRDLRRALSLPERQPQTPNPQYRNLSRKVISCPEFDPPQIKPNLMTKPAIDAALEPVIILPLPHSLYSLKRPPSLANLASLKQSPDMKFNY